MGGECQDLFYLRVYLKINWMNLSYASEKNPQRTITGCDLNVMTNKVCRKTNFICFEE